MVFDFELCACGFTAHQAGGPPSSCLRCRKRQEKPTLAVNHVTHTEGSLRRVTLMSMEDYFRLDNLRSYCGVLVMDLTLPHQEGSDGLSWQVGTQLTSRSSSRWITHPQGT